ncbi:hypothetical protein M9Y10_023621 [Tritrichomonas musculus]|uniref:DUF3447 domain-containing protein n=1 Tax=Tritrichomonas musculus TaxID=1915356 RepID=A0ABR2KVN2_9EUKA
MCLNFTFNDYIQKKTFSSKYYCLFPEIKPFLDKNCEVYLDSQTQEDIKEQRKVEYADNYILQLVQKDLIDEFISYINKTNFKLNDEIKKSLLETNIFLSNINSLKLIDYAAFFGSVQIFKYLISRNCEMTPKLMLFAIHGRSPEIIHIIEEKSIIQDEKMYKDCLKFAIRCHHNELAHYILENYVDENDEEISTFIFKQSLKSYNFAFIKIEMINSNYLFDVCKRDYFFFTRAILQANNSIDINSIIFRKPINHFWILTKEKTCLFCAIEKSNFEIVQLLLEQKNIDVNKKSLMNYCCNQKEELTPLYAAIESQNIKIIQILIDHKDIDINMISNAIKEQLTPLCIAIKYENVEIVRLLVERKDININLKSLEYEEVSDVATYEFYIESTPLYQAVTLGNIEIVQLLLSHKAIDINTVIITKKNCNFDKEPHISERTALIAAVWANRTEIARLLLAQENIDVTINQNEELLHVAVRNKNSEIVRLLLDNKDIDVNRILKGPNIFNPDIWDDEEVKLNKLAIREKVDNYCSFCSSNPFYEEITALYIAVKDNNVEIVKLLVGHGNIDVNMKSLVKKYEYSYNNKGKESEEKNITNLTPLYLAVKNENYEIVQLLINHKNIDINMKSYSYYWKYNGFLIDGIQQEENKQIIEECIDETALHFAISKGNIQIIRALLNHKNIDVNIVDMQNRRPIELTNQKEIIFLIKK